MKFHSLQPSFQNNHQKIKLFELIKKAVHIAAPFFRSEHKKYARQMVSLLFLCVVLLVSLDVVYNFWNKEFFASIEHLQLRRFIFLSLIYFLYVVSAAEAYSLNTFIQGRFSIKWRQWLTHRFMTTYFKNNLSYKL